MNEPIITDTFPKQPRETIWLPVSFAEMLASRGDTARAVDPIELDTMPDGITVVDQVFDPVTSKLQLLVGGGVDGRTYKLSMWINTTSGQHIEHEIKVKVKER